MIALDTNVLVYAARSDSPHHGRARGAIESLAESGRTFAVPWPCAHEFFAVVTRAYRPASTPRQAFAFLRALSQAPSLRWLHEAPHHLDVLESLVGTRLVGGATHDARIAAICIAHGVAELWSADRDFSQFTTLRVRNPLDD